MGFLRPAAWVLPGILLPLAAHAAGPPLVTSLEGTLSGLAGAGDIYNAGSSLQIGFGSEQDESNRAGELHASYLNQLYPVDPSDTTSSLKHTENWIGGFTVNLWRKGSFGIDVDSLTDASEQLQSDGVRFMLGHEPFKFFYRYARDVITQSFKFGIKPHIVDATGAFIYQHNFELEVETNPGRSDTVTWDVAYSLFSPDAPAFASLFTLPNLATISTFRDTLESLEEWSAGVSWKHEFRRRWDSLAEFRFAHLIIDANPAYEAQLALGYAVTPQFHVQAGWNYTYDPVQHQSGIQVELRYAWDRKDED